MRLTPLKIEDYDHLVHFASNEPELWTYSLVQANSPKKLEKYIEIALEGRKNKNAYAFVVFDKRTNQYAGSTRFYDIQIELLHFSWVLRGMEKNFKERD